MQFKHCTIEIDGPVAVLRLDHQEVMNAVSMDMLGGLSEAFDAIEDRKDEVRCVVLTGAGRAFCTGANLQGRGQQQKPGPEHVFPAGLRKGFPEQEAAAGTKRQRGKCHLGTRRAHDA